LETKIMNSTLERERINTANLPPTSGPMGADAVAGAMAGGLAGHSFAASIDPTVEEAYWREHYSSRPYVTGGATFNEYRPAYSYGVDAHRRFEGRSFEQVEPELMRDWDRVKGTSSLTWENAKLAARDSWQRVSDFVERTTPGDSDHDGK
jgi:hypothetical protein